jgi:small GTP-binding protein
VIAMDIEEKIREIEEEIRRTPYNKATAHHIGKLKAKLSRLREEAVSRTARKGKGFHVKKSGDVTIVLVGFPSVGKSTLLNLITNAQARVGEYQFTTLDVIPAIMEYKGARIQVLDIPGIIPGASKGRGRGRDVLSVARNADLIVMIIDVLDPQQRRIILEELRNVGIRPDEKPPDIKVRRKKRGGIQVSATIQATHLNERIIRSILNEYGIHNAGVILRDDATIDQFIDVIEGNRVYIPTLTVFNKIDLVDDEYTRGLQDDVPGSIFISAKENINIREVKEKIFEKLNLIRVYLKPQHGEPDYDEPLIIRRGSGVRDVCGKLHRDFIKKFRYARVWGNSVKFQGQKVGMDHTLEDGDLITIITRR